MSDDSDIHDKRGRGPIARSMLAQFGENWSKRSVTAGEFIEAVDLSMAAIKQLTLRLEALEQRGTRFCGVWQRALSYRPGEVVVFDGAGWIAVADSPPGVAPAKDPARWQGFTKASEASALRSLDLRLSQQIAAAYDSAEKAVSAYARTAAWSAERAEAAAKNRRPVEKVTVTRHDSEGRIQEFIKQQVEE